MIFFTSNDKGFDAYLVSTTITVESIKTIITPKFKLLYKRRKLFGGKNGILLPKLFRPTVRKNCACD